MRYFARLYHRPTGDPRRLLAEFDLEDVAEMPVSQFSKGMKTRLGVARAMLRYGRVVRR